MLMMLAIACMIAYHLELSWWVYVLLVVCCLLDMDTLSELLKRRRRPVKRDYYDEFLAGSKGKKDRV